MREKRQHQRVEFDVEVEVQPQAGERLLVRAKDLSVGGMYLISEISPEMGAVVRLKFNLPGRGEVELPAYVRWRKVDGFGIQFGALGARETHAIGKLIRNSAIEIELD